MVMSHRLPYYVLVSFLFISFVFECFAANKFYVVECLIKLKFVCYGKHILCINVTQSVSFLFTH